MTQNSSGIRIPVPIAQGGTNAITADAAAVSLGVVRLTGDTMSGELILFGNPTNALGATPKQYVDAIASGLDFKDACYAASTANLNAIYANGAAGEGATLTNNGALAAFSIDGVSPPINSRILVKDQTTTLENGIYTLTTVGSGAVAWVLTRATDFDTPAEIPAGAWTIINNGTVNALTSWVQTATVTTIGVDAITFSQFSAGVGANTALSNLIATSINQNLLPSADITRNLGTPTLRWDIAYIQEILTGTTAADELVLGAYDVDGATYVDFISLTAGNTPTCQLSGSVTGVTQPLGTDNTTLATTAFVEDAIDDLSLTKANINLGNLAGVAINTSLVSDTDLADDLGSQAIRWDQLFVENVCTGDTAGDVLTLSGWDVDGASYVEFLTITANNTPTCALAGSVTSVTQAPLDNSTKLATTAYVDAATGGGSGANVSLSNLVAVAINTSLVSDTDLADSLGSPTIRWDEIFCETLSAGHTIGNVINFSARDVDGATTFDFITATSGNTPTCVINGSVTGTTQAANDNSTKLATTAYADSAASARANVALSNLSGVSINTSLISDTDVTDNLGSQAIRWNNIYTATVQTGDTAADTLQIGAWDVDGAVFVPFFTCTAGNTPTGVLASSVTGTTQAASDNSTKLATTAYVDNQVSTSGANTALSNLAAVAINTTLVSDTDNTDDLGSGTVRWANVYPVTLRTGTTSTNTMKLQARDVDGAAWTDFITLTAANTPTCAIAGATITGGTVSSLATDLAVADGGTGLSSATAYAVLCGGTTSTNPFQSIASVGTAGQALVSNGAGALPTFQTVSGVGGSLTFLGSATASASATIDFANLLSATYDNYLIVAEGVLPATNAVTTQCRVGTGAGPTYQTSSYSGNGYGYAGAGSYASGTGAMDLNIASRTSSTASRVGGGQVWIKNSQAATDKVINSNWQNWDSSGSNDNITMLGARWQSSTVLTSFRFLMSSGNISSGIYKLYGIANS